MTSEDFYNHHLQERMESSGIHRQPAAPYSGSIGEPTPKNMSSNHDAAYKTYSDSNHPPSKNNTIRHDDWNDQKSLGGTESRTNSTITLYTAEKSNTEYFNLPGVCKRTGCSIVELIVWAIRQLIDNSVDFVETNYDENLTIGIA